MLQRLQGLALSLNELHRAAASEPSVRLAQLQRGFAFTGPGHECNTISATTQRAAESCRTSQEAEGSSSPQLYA
eukprot:9351724-Alexandrium_andersonii.AAC.1